MFNLVEVPGNHLPVLCLVVRMYVRVSSPIRRSTRNFVIVCSVQAFLPPLLFHLSRLVLSTSSVMSDAAIERLQHNEEKCFSLLIDDVIYEYYSDNLVLHCLVNL